MFNTFFVLTILATVYSVPFPEDSNVFAQTTDSLLNNSDKDVGYDDSQGNSPESIFQNVIIADNVSPMDKSLDICTPDDRIRRRGKACSSNIETSKPINEFSRPQKPREGVSLRPSYLKDTSAKSPSDPQCVNFWKRPIYLTCGGPEVAWPGDKIFDNIYVLNCLMDEVQTIEARGWFEKTSMLGKYCCNSYEAVGPQWRGVTCATLASQPDAAQSITRLSTKEYEQFANDKRRIYGNTLPAQEPENTLWNKVKKFLNTPLR